VIEAREHSGTVIASLAHPPFALRDQSCRIVAERRDLDPAAHAPRAEHAAHHDVRVGSVGQAAAGVEGFSATERLTSIATVSESFAPLSFQ